MLATQELLNQATIGYDWEGDITTDFPLAIMQECAEAHDHLGWKWWTKQPVNLPAAQMEVVDILHFVLAQELQNKYDYALDDRQLVEKLYLDYRSKTVTVELGHLTYDPSSSTPRLITLISGLAATRRVSFGLTCLLAEKLGLEFTALYRLYSCKATLNLFRQKNGYKIGKYKKLWDGKLEDNDVLQRDLAPTIDWDKPGAAHDLYHKLEEAYAIVLDR